MLGKPEACSSILRITRQNRDQAHQPVSGKTRPEGKKLQVLLVSRPDCAALVQRHRRQDVHHLLEFFDRLGYAPPMPLRTRISLGALLQFVLKSDLLRAMEAIADQRLVDGPQIGKSGSDQGDPFIVNPARAYGQKRSRRSARNITVAPVTNLCLAKTTNRPASRSCLRLPAKPSRCHSVPPSEAVLLVDEIGIREDQTRLRMSHELLLGAFKTIGIPDVVLVAERDQVPGTEPNGLFKILADPKVWGSGRLRPERKPSRQIRERWQRFDPSTGRHTPPTHPATWSVAEYWRVVGEEMAHRCTCIAPPISYAGNCS